MISIIAGFGFDNENGPFLKVDTNDGISTSWSRENRFLREQHIKLQHIEIKYCIGYYNLMQSEGYPCPTMSTTYGRFINCKKCFDTTGFNPAFHRLQPSELSMVQQKYNMLPHYVYLVDFGSQNIKVGIAFENRLFDRWSEQGARSATVVGLFNTAYDARVVEDYINKNFQIPEVMRINKKNQC